MFRRLINSQIIKVLRKSKQFGLISIFHFPNAECTNTDGTLGECYTAQVKVQVLQKKIYHVSLSLHKKYATTV